MSLYSNKRKLEATPASTASDASKRRRIVQPTSNTSPTNSDNQKSPRAQPTFRPIARPARWRSSKRRTASEQSLLDTANLGQHRQHLRPVRNEHVTNNDQAPSSGKVELRFSFKATTDRIPEDYRREEPLNKSFSELLVAANHEESTSEQEPQSRLITSRKIQAKPFIPELSKPKKKRDGYGFSYSETFWCDSDEYPDTECDWEAEDHPTQPSAQPSTSIKQSSGWDTEKQTTQASFGGSTVVDSGCSFDDAVVLRDVGSFHIAKPQRILPCTKATREDTIRLKNQAKVLLNTYHESSDIQAQLLARLERMIYCEQRKSHLSGQTQLGPVHHCALRLQDFLLKIREERVETGEHRRFVEHEIEWVKWIVEASLKGVMHLRTTGCKCRPDWEEDEE
ncbi:Nn.00g069570.m01.CDS01 [Neocucurbitaria sp. VM-36]